MPYSYIRLLRVTDTSIAVDFLLRNGFHFDRPYTYGVPYLSRKDEVDINAAWIAIDKQKAALADPEDGEPHDFPAIHPSSPRVRRLIRSDRPPRKRCSTISLKRR